MKQYRIRRGRRVEIPPEWVGKVPNPQTIRKRRSKQGKQQRAMQSHPSKSGDWFTKEYMRWRREGESSARARPTDSTGLQSQRIATAGAQTDHALTGRTLGASRGDCNVEHLSCLVGRSESL